MVSHIFFAGFNFILFLISGSNSKITLLDDWDQSIQAITWSHDGQSLFLELGEEARNVIYHLSNIFTNQSRVRLLNNGTSHDINLHPTDTQTFVFTYASILEPTNIYLYSPNRMMRSMTDHNKVLLAKVRMSLMAEKFSFEGARGDRVWGWHVPPPSGTSQRTPLALLIHGGPQSSWTDAWSYRWNFQSFSSQGYAVIAINFHGSDTYGQNFTDSITGEYGSLPYEDLQLGLTHALTNFSYIDPNRAVALGASYGGFMINWIAGHPEMSSRFKTLICHDGLFDMRGMGYSTEELWFTEYDAGGYTPWANPEAYERYNPVNHVANWSLPMLIIHGGRDYRVPDTQGISAFTALQRLGIESRLLYLPNENHWVLNPLNSLVWYEQVLGWMHKWTN
jgi:dipeptidyl aminopeptidase/acylaminoacyl peptidase